MRQAAFPCALCAICFLLLPVAAQGQAGKALDPDSPAGVEYQLPLETARKNGNGPGGGGAGSRGEGGSRGGPAALFGAGIIAAKGSASAQNGGGGGDTGDGDVQRSGSSGQGSSGASGGARSDDAGGRTDVAGMRQSSLGAPDADESSATLRIAGIALAVLLVGGLLGLVLRRGLRHSAE